MVLSFEKHTQESLRGTRVNLTVFTLSDQTPLLDLDTAQTGDIVLGAARPRARSAAGSPLPPARPGSTTSTSGSTRVASGSTRSTTSPSSPSAERRLPRRGGTHERMMDYRTVLVDHSWSLEPRTERRAPHGHAAQSLEQLGVALGDPLVGVGGRVGVLRGADLGPAERGSSRTADASRQLAGRSLARHVEDRGLRQLRQPADGRDDRRHARGEAVADRRADASPSVAGPELHRDVRRRQRAPVVVAARAVRAAWTASLEPEVRCRLGEPRLGSPARGRPRSTSLAPGRRSARGSANACRSRSIASGVLPGAVREHASGRRAGARRCAGRAASGIPRPTTRVSAPGLPRESGPCAARPPRSGSGPAASRRGPGPPGSCRCRTGPGRPGPRAARRRSAGGIRSPYIS